MDDTNQQDFTVYTKSLRVNFDATTFPGGVLPPQFVNPIQSVEMDKALVMLGSVTIPGGFSVASPARYWACLRYFSALSLEPDLRITNPFADLDPHQKAVLSDDFGVAITTQWLERVADCAAEQLHGAQLTSCDNRMISIPNP